MTTLVLHSCHFIHLIPYSYNLIHFKPDELTLLGDLDIFAFNLHGPDFLNEFGLGAQDSQLIPDQNRPLGQFDHTHLNTVKIMCNDPYLCQGRINCQALPRLTGFV